MKKLYNAIRYHINRFAVEIGYIRSGVWVSAQCSYCKKVCLFDHSKVSDEAIKNNLVVHICDKCDKKHVQNNLVTK